MENNKTNVMENTGIQKLSYEQLTMICGKLQEQNEQFIDYTDSLKKQLDAANEENALKGVEILFKTLSMKELFSDKFNKWAVALIENTLMIEEPATVTSEGEQDSE